MSCELPQLEKAKHLFNKFNLSNQINSLFERESYFNIIALFNKFKIFKQFFLRTTPITVQKKIKMKKLTNRIVKLRRSLQIK